MDIFEKYLKKADDNKYVIRALTAKSYKNIDHTLEDKDTAEELATLGDAIIKFCYAKELLDQVEQLSKEIEKYVTDERFVKVIAKHYNLLKFIKIDENDEKIKRDYEYVKPKKTRGKNKKEGPYKFIATAVEALIGAIYLDDNNNLDNIIKLLMTWEKF